VVMVVAAPIAVAAVVMMGMSERLHEMMDMDPRLLLREIRILLAEMMGTAVAVAVTLDMAAAVTVTIMTADMKPAAVEVVDMKPTVVVVVVDMVEEIDAKAEVVLITAADRTVAATLVAVVVATEVATEVAVEAEVGIEEDIADEEVTGVAAVIVEEVVVAAVTVVEDVAAAVVVTGEVDKDTLLTRVCTEPRPLEHAVKPIKMQQATNQLQILQLLERVYELPMRHHLLQMTLSPMKNEQFRQPKRSRNTLIALMVCSQNKIAWRYTRLATNNTILSEQTLDTIKDRIQLEINKKRDNIQAYNIYKCVYPRLLVYFNVLKTNNT